MKRHIPRRNIVLTGSALLALVLGTGSAALAAAGDSPATRTPSTPSSSISALERASTEADRLPLAFNFADLGDGGITPSSSRLVGQTELMTIWAANDAKGNVCLVVGLHESGAAAASCDTAERFAARGLSLQAGAEGDAVEAYLVPDEALLRLPRFDSAGGSLSPNLILADPHASSSDRQRASDDSLSAARPGETFPLMRFAMPIELG